jgi:hypothetical protein
MDTVSFVQEIRSESPESHKNRLLSLQAKRSNLLAGNSFGVRVRGWKGRTQVRSFMTNDESTSDSHQSQGC